MAEEGSRINLNADLEIMSAEELKAEIQKLWGVMRAHRDTEGDDRCWEDDALLYGSLPEGACPLKEFTPEEKSVLIARCSRYWDTRRYPANTGKVHEWGTVARQGLYRHYKGKLYLVHGVAVHSETGEHLVVYRPLYGSFQLMVRPETMFIEEVDAPEYDYKGPRFQFVSEMF